VSQTIGPNWLVKSGIEAGDRVIVEGLQYARAGQKAIPVPFKPAAPRASDAAVPPAPAASAAK